MRINDQTLPTQPWADPCFVYSPDRYIYTVLRRMGQGGGFFMTLIIRFILQNYNHFIGT